MRSDSAELVGPREAAATLVQAVEAAMTPASGDSLENWLAELDVIAPKRADDTMTMALRLRAYTTRLSAYPADVARAALLDHLWNFWPSWAELHEVCERLVRERRLILVAARRAAAPPIEEHREVVSPERKAQIMEELGVNKDWLDGLRPKAFPKTGEGRDEPPAEEAQNG